MNEGDARKGTRDMTNTARAGAGMSKFHENNDGTPYLIPQGKCNATMKADSFLFAFKGEYNKALT